MLCRKILNEKDMEKLQIDLDRLGDWAAENEMKVNQNKSKAISFMRARGRDPLITLLGTKIFLKLASANIWESSYEVI
jgi:predicted membrane GTPase involved in stress response